MKSKIFYSFLFIIMTRALGVAFLPALLKFSPVLLIILSPFLHHLILTSSLLTPLLFFTISIGISLVQCLLGYEFGLNSGTLSLEWCVNRGIISVSKKEFLLKWVRFSAPLALILIPGPLIAMVTGISQLKRRVFFFFMIPSQIVWISFCYFLGTELEVYLSQIKVFLIEHWIFLTLVFIGLTTLKMWKMKKKPKT